MKSLLSCQTNTETAPDNQSDSAWQKTACANLYCFKPSGAYFAHIKIRGKLIRRSLKTKLQSVAKLRLGNLEKAERQTADSMRAVSGGKMTFGDALPRRYINTRKDTLFNLLDLFAGRIVYAMNPIHAN
jgi:hypothetical protein